MCVCMCVCTAAYVAKCIFACMGEEMSAFVTFGCQFPSQIVTLCVVLLSGSFICNVHPVHQVKVPRIVLETLSALAGQRSVCHHHTAIIPLFLSRCFSVFLCLSHMHSVSLTRALAHASCLHPLSLHFFAHSLYYLCVVLSLCFSLFVSLYLSPPQALSPCILYARAGACVCV